jgi:Family of unknown function (DUF6131)
MIVLGIILLLVAYLLPDLVPVPPGVEHVLSVLGWIAIIVGILLLLFGHFSGRTIGNRRYWF